MPEESPHTETLREIAEKLEQETRIHREHLNCLKDSFRTNRGNLTDAELLEIILDASSLIDKPEFDQEDNLDAHMDSLAFTTISLIESDGESLKTAWSEFLGKTFLDMKDRADDLYDIVAAWYFSKEMWSHSVAVYEYLYRQVRSGELVNDQESHAWWVLQLWKSCVKRGLKQRARELFGRIAEYHDDGEIVDADYYEILLQELELRDDETRETFEQDRCLAEERLRLDHGHMFDGLHPRTKGYVINAELWSDNRRRHLEPSAGPLGWALAIEAEFHQKVYKPHRDILTSALKRSLKTCGPRDISDLINLSFSGSFDGRVISGVFETLIGGRGLTSIANLDALEVICEHRKQIAHVTNFGPYTSERCNNFLRILHDSGWLFKFLSALQPR